MNVTSEVAGRNVTSLNVKNNSWLTSEDVQVQGNELLASEDADRSAQTETSVLIPLSV